MHQHELPSTLLTCRSAEKSSDEMKCGVWRVKCEVWGVKSAVWSVKCGVWRKQWDVRSVKCGLWSVKFGVRRVQCEVWSVECEVWSLECEECSVKCEVWSVKCEVWSLKSTVWSEVLTAKGAVWRVQCEGWSVKCAVWSVKTAVRSAKCEVELQMWHVKQDTTFAECTRARAWLAHGACKFYRWERSYIYISLRQLPPRLVRVLLVISYFHLSSSFRSSIYQLVSEPVHMTGIYHGINEQFPQLMNNFHHIIITFHIIPC